MKLAPPYVEGSIHAQAGDSLHIPFRFNRAVSPLDVSGMSAKIKTVATDSIVGVFDIDTFVSEPNSSNYIASVDINDELAIGQFYKIQLAFKDKTNEQGYFSTVGVFKYSAVPSLYIEGIGEAEIGNLYTYTGVYDQTGPDQDPTEKEYSYQFDVLYNGHMIASSGQQLHDARNDEVVGKSSNTWVLNQQLQEGLIYTLRYTVTTVNGMVKTLERNVVNNEIEDTELIDSYDLIATNDYDNGRVFLTLKPKKEIHNLKGGFIISRSSSKDNYQTWNEIRRFALITPEALPETLWIDYTVEQGVSYYYAIQRYNDSGFYSARVLTETPVLADFEDMFLYDGIRQLKVQFNPKVSSFKTTTMESKMDTIGGKYPFFFRNGDIGYNEFPISGLISHLSDMDELFTDALELSLPTAALLGLDHRTSGREIIRTTNLDSYNIAAEREFKMQVLQWLNNGEPKIFRSPAEGNYLVRLMNVSLSPNDTVGRMLHTFNATAYEMDEFNFENLLKYKFVSDYKNKSEVMVMETVTIDATNYRTQQNYLAKYTDGVYHAEFYGVEPGTIFELRFLNGNSATTISIPTSGFYKVNIYEHPLISVKCISIPRQFKVPKGYIDVGYRSTVTVGDFSAVRKVVISDTSYDKYGHNNITNHIDVLEDIKNKVGHVHELRVETRENKQVYFYNNAFYTSYEVRNGVSYWDKQITDFEERIIYRVKNYASTAHHDSWWFEGRSPQIYTKSQTVPPDPTYVMHIKLEGYDEQAISIGNYSNIGDSIIDPAIRDVLGEGKAGLYQAWDLNKIEKLSIDNGLHLFMWYQKKEYIYGIEEDDETLARLKESGDSQFLVLLEKKLKEAGVHV